jgi:hydrogenase/urease accessory protein HupE
VSIYLLLVAVAAWFAGYVHGRNAEIKRQEEIHRGR